MFTSDIIGILRLALTPSSFVLAQDDRVRTDLDDGDKGISRSDGSFVFAFRLPTANCHLLSYWIRLVNRMRIDAGDGDGDNCAAMVVLLEKRIDDLQEK
jgi:hypothetical protein